MEATAACSRKVARHHKSLSCKFKWIKLCSNLIKAYIRPKSRMLRVHRKVLRKFALKIVLSRVYFRFQTLPSSVCKKDYSPLVPIFLRGQMPTRP